MILNRNRSLQIKETDVGMKNLGHKLPEGNKRGDEDFLPDQKLVNASNRL